MGTSEENKIKLMPEKLRAEWERMRGCYLLLKEKKAMIVRKCIEGKQISYTEPFQKWQATGLTFGNYRISQRSENIIAIIYHPENRLVHQCSAVRWLSNEELTEVFEEWKRDKDGAND